MIKNETIHVRVTPKIKNMVLEMAFEENRSMANMLAVIIQEAYKKRKKEIENNGSEKNDEDQWKQSTRTYDRNR